MRKDAAARKASSSVMLEDIRAIWPDHRPTPLVESPELAAITGVEQLWLKVEAHRPLGNFKSLGGMVAALRAIARAAGVSSVAELLARRPAEIPSLICASDGNHGLAVASAAQRVGGSATVFLPVGVSQYRIEKIVAVGADVRLIAGTYDDAVLEAVASARRGEGLLVPDTTQDPDDQAVMDVMNGYEMIADEIVAQLPDRARKAPSHIFVQAGVGGLAAAMIKRFQELLPGPRALIVVEPDRAPCVSQALAAGRVVAIPGDLRSNAEMLSCGMASAPALDILLRHDARSLTVTDADLDAALAVLTQATGLRSTVSGAAGLAGALRCAGNDELRNQHGLNAKSGILLCITEGAAPR
jgi:diaminopropionate ammonia-lyase